MRIFEYLGSLRSFERRHLPFLRSREDCDLVIAIGAHQERGTPLTLKQLYGLDIGSMATLQRRLSRLKRLGVVVHRRSPRDGRNMELELSPRTSKIFQRYATLVASGQAASGKG